MIVCSISHQNNPQIIHLNVICMLVSSLLCSSSFLNAVFLQEVGQGWANIAKQVTSCCPCGFNYWAFCCLVHCDLWLRNGRGERTASVFLKCPRGNVRTVPCGNVRSLNSVIAPHSQINIACIFEGFYPIIIIHITTSESEEHCHAVEGAEAFSACYIWHLRRPCGPPGRGMIQVVEQVQTLFLLLIHEVHR